MQDKGKEMNIVVNGEIKEVKEDITIQELIEFLSIKVGVMAVAVNMNIVKKDDWDSFKLNQDDKVELLQFVGGG
ncbi:putative thiamine biosynthesis protein ThiS [Sulfurovum sp. enrichment culture clone C5]|uniref:Putative thiamine biosynthesis protein ThiS n=1 Tax=Sulfurovum sp. enrichment culture clone C5 TaxID=497650 RepID=A0A0S4XMH4_9BACT|nr:putative thiamine biosynthesis protein ThiS [Sulfurovum sp. enrichment culture clone C5]